LVFHRRLSRGASKWAVEAFHESLAQEVKGFGIKVTLIEPGANATEFAREAWEAEGSAAGSEDAENAGEST
jgi:NAD(P)-dependent dehydrogenase (short-subunit alcohol dehydrogenase family)